MKKYLLPLLTLSMVVLACSLPFSVGTQPTAAPPTVAPQPTVILPTLEPTEPPTQSIPVATAGGLSVTLFSPLAAGYTLEVIPAVSDETQSGPWAIAPEHVRIQLPNYPLQGKFHQPAIYIYPASSLAIMNEGAGYNIKTLQDILAPGVNLPRSPQDLPGVFFFNAGGIFASNISRLSFQNGSGARWLTQYAQSFAPFNNFEMIYLYQGLTDDQAYYVIAILPITHPALAADDNLNTVLPAAGIPFPEDWEKAGEYYQQVSNLLEAASPDSFTPRLSDLDALLSGMKIFPAP